MSGAKVTPTNEAFGELPLQSTASFAPVTWLNCAWTTFAQQQKGAIGNACRNEDLSTSAI
jgi:hypothetical protein